MGKAWVFIQIMSICSCLLPCNIAYHGIPNEVLAPVQVDNAGCLLGGNYKAPMVIIPKKISQVWSLIIIGTEFDLFGASVRKLCSLCGSKLTWKRNFFNFTKFSSKMARAFFFQANPFILRKSRQLIIHPPWRFFTRFFFRRPQWACKWKHNLKKKIAKT